MAFAGSDEASALRLPYIDEHTTIIAADTQTVWPQLLTVVDISFSGTTRTAFARALKCVHSAPSGPRPLVVGAKVVGSEVVRANPASELVLEGSHRFSTYSLTFRLQGIDPARSRLTAETRAMFPGPAGAVYRSLVIGTRGHVVVVKLMLAQARRRSERRAGFRG